MEDKVRIKIQVGDNKHPLFVERSEEPIFRDAARMVNERIQAYATKYRGAGLPNDYLMAFAALDVAVQFVRQDRNSNAEAAGEDLREIAAEIREFLKD